MIDLPDGGAVDQTAIFVPRRELVPEVKRVIGRNLTSGTRGRPAEITFNGRSRSWGDLARSRSGAHLRPGRGTVARGNRVRGLCLPTRWTRLR
jgi:hypothetical protein